MRYRVRLSRAVWQDYRARIHSFRVGCLHSFNIDRILEKLEKERAHGLHSFNGRDLSMELEGLC
jgi:hypothetical protein